MGKLAAFIEKMPGQKTIRQPLPLQSKTPFTMRFFIKIVLTSLLLLTQFAAQAQPGDRGHGHTDLLQRAEEQTALMVEKLSLTPEQTVKVREINLAAAQKMKQALDGAKGGRSEMRSKMQAVFAEQDAALQQVLTASQWQQRQKIKDENRPKHGRH